MLFQATDFFTDACFLYKQNLAKLYAGLLPLVNQDPSEYFDISGIDEGESQYVRGYWLLQN
jgi:hypothetical protein